MKQWAITIHKRATPTDTYQGFVIHTGYSIATDVVYKEAYDVVVMDNGTLLLVDENYNNIAGFASGQWLEFEEIIENESESTVDNTES